MHGFPCIIELGLSGMVLAISTGLAMSSVLCLLQSSVKDLIDSFVKHFSAASLAYSLWNERFDCIGSEYTLARCRTMCQTL